MNAHERLWNAVKVSREGCHEEALQEFIWFHHHALEEDPALYGVRRSFALGLWTELGKAYPKALDALRSTRSDKAEALLRGEGGPELFLDIAAIDAQFGDTAPTYALFLRLTNAFPDLAQQCERHALPAIVDAQDYALAARLMPAPEPLVCQRARGLEQDINAIKHASFTRAPTRWACICNYVEEIKRLVTILSGSQQHAEGARIKALAIGLIKSPSVRRDVEATFIKRPNAPRR